VNAAMQTIYTRHGWTPVQRRWLDRLAKQLTHEVIIDNDFVNRAFSTDGGAKRLNKILGNHLDQVLVELAEGVWESAG
jgi:type I restriction enzyme R subunit